MSSNTCRPNENHYLLNLEDGNYYNIYTGIGRDAASGGLVFWLGNGGVQGFWSGYPGGDQGSGGDMVVAGGSGQATDQTQYTVSAGQRRQQMTTTTTTTIMRTTGAPPSRSHHDRAAIGALLKSLVDISKRAQKEFEEGLEGTIAQQHEYHRKLEAGEFESNNARKQMLGSITKMKNHLSSCVSLHREEVGQARYKFQGLQERMDAEETNSYDDSVDHLLISLQEQERTIATLSKSN